MHSHAPHSVVGTELGVVKNILEEKLSDKEVEKPEKVTEGREYVLSLLYGYKHVKELYEEKHFLGLCT